MYGGKWVPNKSHAMGSAAEFHVGPHIMIIGLDQKMMQTLNQDASNGEPYVNNLHDYAFDASGGIESMGRDRTDHRSGLVRTVKVQGLLCFVRRVLDSLLTGTSYEKACTRFNPDS
jgi:hypothetical protein